MEKLFEKKVNINAVNNVSGSHRCDSDCSKGGLGLHRSTKYNKNKNKNDCAG